MSGFFKHLRRRRTACLILAGLLILELTVVRELSRHAGVPPHLVWIGLLGGVAICAVLLGIAWAEAKARTLAEETAANLRRSAAAHAEESKRLATTLDSISDGVITTDPDGRILSLNQAARGLTGWAYAGAEGRLLSDTLVILQEQNRQPCPDLVKEVLQTGKIVELPDRAVLVSRDQDEFAVTGSAAPIHDPDHKITGVAVVFRDITEKRRSEEELFRQSKLESVGLLAGGIAHDFNNILLSIVGNVSLARMASHSTEKVLERLASVEKSALRAKDLTQQLLTFAKGGEPIKRTLPVTGMVREACEFALHGSNVQCELSLPEDAWPVEVDDGQFRQVLNNLVINAMQSMPEGGKMEVRTENVELSEGFLSPLPAGKYLKISIKDHGRGIPPEALARVFEPYFSAQKYASGLGLATAYSVVRKHGGQIRVESAVGAGTTFHVYLPASLRTAAAAPAAEEQKHFFGQGRLLVMDDEPDILMIICDMLKSFGYEVETVRDGAEAIEQYLNAKKSGRPFDAIIMDLTIPNGMGGRETIRRLRELDPDVKALVSSGYSLDPVMANYRQYGFRGIIPKPYRLDELQQELEQVLGRRAAE